MGYLPLTDADRETMLEAIGVASVEELFRDIPSGLRFDRPLDLEPALSEQELVAHLGELAAKNVHTGQELSFVGAGIYDHYVPAVVDDVLRRGQFLTAYTPYQPELSQGVLQAIFEYQTAICELTGMDVSNASGYDGTTVAADACFVAKHATGRDRIVITEATNPQVRQVVRTYAPGFGLEVVEVPHEDGVTDPEAVRAAAEGAAAVIFQQPNFFGCLEDAPALAAAANDAGALAVAHVDPLSLGVLEAPGNYGCALAIGEGQAAGNALSFGGPHYGFLAAKEEYTRRLPGRIIGETTDLDGRRGFVLTLQTREQHIRREKATSNITTNQTLLALGGLVYLSWLGPQGLREVGERCLTLAEHTKRLLDLPPAFGAPTFKEFAVRLGRPARGVVEECRAEGVNPGYPLGRDYPGMDDVLLVAVTEKRTLADIERLVEVLTCEHVPGGDVLMAIPNFQALMLPFLEITADGAVHEINAVTVELADSLGLSPAERSEVVPSGKQTRIRNRVAWTRTHLKHAGLIETVGRGTFRITERGQELLATAPTALSMKLLAQYPEYVEFRAGKLAGGSVEQGVSEASDSTPEEQLESAYASLSAALAEELLDRLATVSPTFFERLVVDLLVEMGYGGSRRDAGEAVGQSGDGGIDGIIKEDRLGLDAVYIQAKRWSGTVGRPVVQAFAGSLEGHRARKGVLITTSTFSQEARDYVEKIEKRIVLIDGPRLAELMIEFGVAVTDVVAYTVKRLDEDYFEGDVVQAANPTELLA